MAKVWIAPTGKCIRGHVLDCSERGLAEALKLYDTQLYLAWNPKKLKGYGLWEVRRRPENKTVTDYCVYQGNTYCKVEYKENRFDNHVIDVPFLNYQLLEKIKKMDTWTETRKGEGWAKELEYKEAKIQEKLDAKSSADVDYMAKQHKSQIRGLMELVLSGENPARIADHWGKLGS